LESIYTEVVVNFFWTDKMKGETQSLNELNALVDEEMAKHGSDTTEPRPPIDPGLDGLLGEDNRATLLTSPPQES